VLHRVAILYHPRKPKAIAEAEWLCSELRNRNIEIVMGNGWDAEVVTRDGCGRDLVVALGGDGTILHVARLLAPCAVPVLGINLGRVGFLAEMTPEDLHDRVDELVEGKFWIERRTMLEVEWRDGDVAEEFHCLNEVVVARGSSPRAIHIRTVLDGREFMTYTADAVMVATATGSTAYSLAAGGPILYPEAREFMLTPVAPHLHIGRSIILPPQMTVTLGVTSEGPAVMSVDGTEDRALRPGHVVQVRRSATDAVFARLGSTNYFYEAIAERLR
jgi:NAD+ kinase